MGEYLNFYFANEHSAYFILNGLNYGFSHQEKVLIATLIKLNGKKVNPYNLEPYRQLLPNTHIISWLNFILSLAKILSTNENKIEIAFVNNTLYIYSESYLDLPKDELKNHQTSHDSLSYQSKALRFFILLVLLYKTLDTLFILFKERIKIFSDFSVTFGS